MPTSSTRGTNVTTFVIAAVCVWSVFFFWLYWIISSEANYRRTFWDRVALNTKLQNYTPGETLRPADENKLRFVGWSGVEVFGRWSAAKDVGILFQLSEQPSIQAPAALTLNIGPAVGLQRVTVLINQEEVHQQTVTGTSVLECTFPMRLLKKGVNSVRLLLPDARQPNVHDTRVLGVGLTSFQLRPAAAAAVSRQ